MESTQNGITIDAAPVGRNGRATLTVRLGGDILAVEKLDLGKPKDRTNFIGRLCDGRPGINAAALEGELLRLAADLASRPEAPADSSGMPEVDAAAIVRPERFIVPEVSGVAVPTMTAMGDKVQGRWMLYLRWANGKRERRPMAPALDLPRGRRLWIHPEPSEPTPSTRAGWSASGRKTWLDGKPAPDPAKLFRLMSTLVAKFIDLPRDQAAGVTATVVCWAILTYIFQVFDAVPYLFIGGPLGSGKSRLLEILGRLVFRPLGSSNMTAAAMFRTLHSQGGTLLLDEAERLRNTQDPATAEILSMLLAGYRRGGQATRLEPVGDTFKTVSFDVFGPKALGCVAGLPPALASRCIGITMFRSPPGSEKPRRRIDADAENWKKLRDALHSLALEHGQTWIDLPSRTDVCPATMSGREYELWQPLLSIASWLESHGVEKLLELMQQFALTSVDVGRDDATPDADQTLLRLLAERRATGDWPTSKEILDAARESDKVSFASWSPKGVSNVYRRYGLTTDKMHGRKVYKTEISDLARIQETYGFFLGIEELQAVSE